MYLQEKGSFCWPEDQKQKVLLILTFMSFVLAEEHICALQVPGRHITKDSCDGGRRIFFATCGPHNAATPKVITGMYVQGLGSKGI